MPICIYGNLFLVLNYYSKILLPFIHGLMYEKKWTEGYFGSLPCEIGCTDRKHDGLVALAWHNVQSPKSTGPPCIEQAPTSWWCRSPTNTQLPPHFKGIGFHIHRLDRLRQTGYLWTSQSFWSVFVSCPHICLLEGKEARLWAPLIPTLHTK